MSIQNNLTLPIAQMGHVEKLVEVAQNQPYVQQLASQQAFAQELKRMSERVEQTNPSEGGQKVREKEEEDSQGQQAFSDKDPERQAEQEQPQEEEAASNPWVGNIVNVKI